MIMMTLLFTILFLGMMAKLIGFAFRFSWGLFKVLLCLIFLPLILVAMVFGGLIYFALPVLLVVGLVSMLAKNS